MKNHLIAERYAKGLSACITDPGELEEARLAMNRAREFYEANHDLRSVLANPVIDLAARERVVDAVLEQQAPMPVVAQLVRVLLRRGRIALLPEIATVFSAIADARLNRIEAVVTTAVDLSDEQKAQLTKSLTARARGQLRMEYHVDPDIVGGVVARIGSFIIDGSIRNQLDTLKQQLLSKET